VTIPVSGGPPGCTLGDLRDELKARGFTDMSDARVDAFVNAAHTEFNTMWPWPWLEAVATGNAPMTVSDLGPVETVVDTTDGVLLARSDPRELIAQLSTDLTVEGNPTYWYRSAQDEISVYPVSVSVDLEVRYTREVAELVADGDQTANPKRYCYLVLALAQAMADSNNDDDDDGAAKKLQQVFDRIGRVAARVLVDSVEPGHIEQLDWCQ
jgi:hypothetical protein